MKGVSMGVGTTPVTLAVALFLATVLEAKYLERPLWVADIGRQQSLAYGNDESRVGQLQAANEQTWMMPEPYYPQRTGPANPERVETQQWPQESQNVPQMVREERPPLDSFNPNQGYDEWNSPDTAYEYQTKYQAQSMPNRPSQSAWVNQQPQQVEYQKPYQSQEPPSNVQAQPEPEYYESYGQKGWNREPKPETSQPNNYQPQFQSQEKYKPYRPETYQPKPDTDSEQSFNQPKPGTFMPNQPNVDPFPSNPEEMQQNYAPKRPQEVQQSYNPYPARPEQYQPSPTYVEPEYQVPYYGQHAMPSYTEQEYQMQMSPNKQPSRQTAKPAEQPNKVKKPQPENQGGQAAFANTGYYPYQSQEAWYSQQQTPTEGLQASVQTGPDMRGGDSMTIYQLPSQQGSYSREPIAENPKPVDRVNQQQENRKPSQPLRVEQRPNRPMVQVPEEPQYQPNRVPSTGWETEYNPQPAPVKPKPQPQQRPPMVEPTYNRKPEPHYGGNDDDEVVVPYKKPITRFDNRCPRDDDPAKPVHFPSATSCVKFQKCFNGIAYEMSCPPGLEFDAQSSRCDYPARARCSV